ncbi:hypothetical protein H8B09_07135 [Paenibacillus sp. PR3]|uniref:ABC transporter permease n=1 Tax=Paenibacillus terricola TaxID=2763503 RepID=A0ABR8MVH1_9BACL|nr:hypothetical protein [Paenibacillus terricola]MBD3918524.1 hypothetical protein [Paenibacillus terricola]
MTRTKLWKWYFNLFIRTPIAALFFIVALIAGLTLLINSITVREYASVQAQPMDTQDGTSVTMLAAKLDRMQAEADLKAGDAVVWYVGNSGERYDGEVASIEAGGVGSSVLIRTDASQWKLAVKEAKTDSPSITVDIPIGRQSVKEKLFGRKGGDEQ